jgi:signal transduction histidine kinase
MLHMFTKRIIILVVLGLLSVSLTFTYFVGLREYNYAKAELVDKSRVMAQQIMATRHFLSGNQDKINKDSKGNFEFKGLNPARGIFLIAQDFNQSRSSQIKQTTFPDRVRNPRNLPDQWEIRTLQELQDSPGKAEIYGEAKDKDGNKFFRYAVPLYVDDSCLACHGSPRGEQDVAGFAKEGYKLGDLRGIVSISMPMAGFDTTFRRLVIGLMAGGIAMGTFASVALALLLYVFTLRPAQNQLVQSSQLAAAGRVAADVAHEINNPIGIISSRAELILLENELAETVVEDLQVIKHNAARVADYTRGLLSFARPFSGNREKLDLNHVVVETSTFMEKQLNKRGISVVRDLSSRPPKVWAQKAQIQQVLLNLIANAKDSLAGEGRIVLRTGQVSNHQVFLEVEDNGCGIKPEDLPRVFEPFYSTKGASGTGLGLAVGKTLVEENGGKITVQSNPSQGTVFRITLPGSLVDE